MVVTSAVKHLIPSKIRSNDNSSNDTGNAPQSAPRRETKDDMMAHEEEKNFISQWGEESRPMSPSQVAMDPAQKKVGQSSHHLRLDDFELIKTLGTGTFARVWLTRLQKDKQKGDDNVFALKILRKTDVIRLKQVEHLDYCPGGEVFSYLRRARRFNEPTSQFYAAEIVLILEFLHEKEGVAYRDLKPENILIDAEGHLKLVDFGFAKQIWDRETYTLCGTPEYLAPEVIRNTGHGCAVDWWAFGILVYEFLVGQPPFWDQNPMKIYEQIVEARIRYPHTLSHNARDLISKLCVPDTSKRLGNISGGARTVKAHPFFNGINWDDLYHRRANGPIVPHLRGKADTRNFDEYEPEPPADQRDKYTDELARRYESAFADF
ncbi:hypothetical protein FKW77_009997 [Venturia effusa]|uniref:cAMP-dependent protein kinase n=1 Tax=Venturia effusa TaxID=50376 RepID=A0A517L268_9PEZI|nr:hypothetical protein FKW77_009997 [Venturia effusa]